MKGGEPDERRIDRGPAEGFGAGPAEARVPGGPQVHRREVAAPAEAALAAAGEAAEQWGAGWEAEPGGGRLALPVAAGLRHGRVDGRLSVRDSLPGDRGAGPRSVVELTVETADYHLWTPAVAILLVAAAGGALTVIWPFFPRLLPLAPFGALIALSAWLLVLARLQNRGPEEFLEVVALIAEEGSEEAGEEGSAADRGVARNPRAGT